MAHVEKRPPQTPGGKVKYRVRYQDQSRRERSKTFDRMADAKAFRVSVEADVARGTYLDPAAGRITLRDYAGEWLVRQTFDESTRQATELRLRLHILPSVGALPLVAIRPSHVQGMVRSLQQKLAPRYVRVIVANLSAVLSEAVDDERITRNPCRAGAVRLPRLDPEKVEPWTHEEVAAVRKSLPERYRLVAVLGAGLGLRQGEAFGLAVEDIDFLRGVVHVRRQVKILGGRQVFALPKIRKIRDVPLPESVALAVAAHLTDWPAVPVSLPWESVAGQPVTARLLLSTRERGALERNYFNTKVWKPALVRAGVEPTRRNGTHALRHFYASVLLDAGESIRALADYLGHADPAFTLRTYTHLMPSSEERTKKAVDRVLGTSEGAADGLVTA